VNSRYPSSKIKFSKKAIEEFNRSERYNVNSDSYVGS
jgi:hypothetical protein